MGFGAGRSCKSEKAFGTWSRRCERSRMRRAGRLFSLFFFLLHCSIGVYRIVLLVSHKGAIVFQRSIIPQRAGLPTPNTLLLELFGGELSDNYLFNFGNLSVIDGTGAEKRSHLCAKPKRFAVLHQPQLPSLWCPFLCPVRRTAFYQLDR